MMSLAIKTKQGTQERQDINEICVEEISVTDIDVVRNFPQGALI